MPNTDSEEAYKMIIKVQTACGIYNNKSASEAYSINISLGFATKKTDSEFLSEIVKSAEDHMYKRKLLEHKSSRSAIVSAIKATMFEKNRNTEQHAERISGLSKKLGAVLGLSRGELDDLELLAALHDIGKVGIDENILNKPGALNAEEIADIRKHPEIGYRIAMASPELVSIADYILTHQERWDGAGYPLGLRGEGIPLLSRIIAVVDCYDSITHDKPYRKALTIEQAAEEIRKNAGIQFDPRITEKFLEMIRRMPEEERASEREIAGIA
jgi:HD-GYP domain-containing protein (c-di-GMP phosphodiesterase class II)